jgi:SlyX protein
MNEAHDQFEQMQTKIAYLERSVNELSDVVFRQHQELDALARRLQMLIDRLSVPDETPRTPQQERPPHY